MTIKVLLAEDQAMLRGALVALLSLEPDIEVIGAVGDGEAALRDAHALAPDILITDIEMPGFTGLEVAQRVARFDKPCRVVILTTFARAGYLRRALDAGVSAYLLKDTPSTELAATLRRVQAGERVIAPELAQEAWVEADPLLERERQVLRLAGEGVAATTIAEQLSLSHGTVRNYLSQAIAKLGVSNRIEAYRMARQKGWL